MIIITNNENKKKLAIQHAYGYCYYWTHIYIPDYCMNHKDTICLEVIVWNTVGHRRYTVLTYLKRDMSDLNFSMKPL